MYNSIYPINIRPYSGPRQNGATQDKDGDARSGGNSGYTGQNNQQNGRQRNFYNPQSMPSKSDNFERTTPVASGVSHASAGGDSINIAQVLIDFRNTANAIGVSKELEEELGGYFSLIEKQANKSEPNKKIIQSNLRNASIVLDKYISETLSRPSRVVENWIDTLFMQQVDYSYDEGKINPELQLKFPERKVPNEAQAPTPSEETETSNLSGDEPEKSETAQAPVSNPAHKNKVAEFYVPQDKTLKKMFLQAKKFAVANNSQKALEYFQQALTRSIALDDEQAQSMIYFEAAKVFDKKDLMAPALKNYYKATVKSKDYNIKTKAHYKMARIYDDCVKTEPALEHYFVALSYAGETESLSTQSASLSNIAGMFAQRYQKKEVREFTKLSENIANETKSSKVIGSVLAKGGENYAAMGEAETALSYYKRSTKHFKQVEAPEKLARNFEKAAELMLELGNVAKAKKLYRHAYEQYAQLDDENSMSYIFSQLEKLH